MEFKEIARRLTGLSTPIFSVSWNPSESEINTARKVITYFENKRVLYNPNQMEDPRHCVRSVIEIREFLISEIGSISGKELTANLRAMRAACRKFLNAVDVDDDFRGYKYRGMSSEWVFNSALGEFRGIIGLHVAVVAAKYGLDVEDDLATILPALSDGEEK
jgi:hypothetical protein